MLPLCFVNVPASLIWKNVVVPAFLSLFPSLNFSLCQSQKPSLLSPHLHSSPFYQCLPPSLILEAVTAEQRTKQSTLSVKVSLNISPCSLSHLLSFRLLFLSLSLSPTKWPPNAGTFIFIVLSSPEDPLQCRGVIYNTPGAFREACGLLGLLIH